MNLTASPLTTPTSPSNLGGWTTAATGSQSLSRTSAGCTLGFGLKSAKGLKQPKPKKCKHCKTSFTPDRPLKVVCSPDCAESHAEKKRTLKQAKERREVAKADRARREKLKSRADWAREAQAAFNRWVRLRDHGKPCISCQRHHAGQIHAGHFLSRGARPELAYEPLNCHAQCAPCNTHLSGNIALYRKNLVQLIGPEMVEWLEGPHEPKHFSVDDLKAIRDTYRAKAKELERANG